MPTATRWMGDTGTERSCAAKLQLFSRWMVEHFVATTQPRCISQVAAEQSDRSWQAEQPRRRLSEAKLPRRFR